MASDDQARVQLRAAIRTDVGMVREHNEDNAYLDPDHNFFIVADGMGGHAAGEVASQMAVDKVRELLENARPEILAFSATPDETKRKSLVKVLESAVKTAHQSVYERGTKEPDKAGMGTTLDVVLVAGHEAFVAHVGDSRTYLIRENKAQKITTDHTVAEVLVIEGKLSPEEAQISPLRTILVNAIGVAADVGIEMAQLQLRKGDQLLVCSDGLHDYFPEDRELAVLLDNAGKPEEALLTLVDLAKERGGHDNITGIVVDVLACEPKKDAPLSGEITQKLPAHGVPGTIERDDTMPVRRVDEDDLSDKKKRKKRKKKRKPRSKKSKSEKAAEKKSDEAKNPGKSASDDATESENAAKASDDTSSSDSKKDDKAD